MKPKLALSVLIIGIMMATIASDATAARVTQIFTLTATGEAFDPDYDVWRTVTLTLTGTAIGNPPTCLNFISRGSMTVENYGTFDVRSGSGMLIPRWHYIMLYMKITHLYGGAAAFWHLRGWTGSWTGNILPITFSADRVSLPLQGRPILYSLFLTGTITIN